MKGSKSRVVIFIYPLAPVIPAGAHQTTVRPFDGEKVHWTFSVSRLTSRRARGCINRSFMTSKKS
jgi:hypothetical protein